MVWGLAPLNAGLDQQFDGKVSKAQGAPMKKTKANERSSTKFLQSIRMAKEIDVHIRYDLVYISFVPPNCAETLKDKTEAIE